MSSSGTGWKWWRWRWTLTLDGDDELRHDGEDFGAAVLQHVVDPLPRQDLVRVSGLAQAVEEERQEVVVVQLVDLHLGTSNDNRR